MTTKKFSTLTLPQPRYSCQIGCCDVTSRTATYINAVADNHDVECPPATPGCGDASNLAKWLPPFTDLIQLIEVRRTGCTAESVLKPLTNLVEPLLECTSGSGIVIENARPELFLRRDFISSFVDRGLVYMWPMWLEEGSGIGEADHQYQISCKENVISILLNERQYRRFGLLAKKVTRTGSGGSSSSRRHSRRRALGRQYRIDINLKENQITKSNKYQERLVTTLRRLSPVNKLYFRFAPCSSEPATTTGSPVGVPPGAASGAAAEAATATSSPPSPGERSKRRHQQQAAATDKCMEFFRFVMREYAEDGLKPVPLTGCYKVGLKVDRSWTNYSQGYPNLRLPLEELQLAASSSSRDSPSSCKLLTTVYEPPVHRNVELLKGVLDLVNWLGYQVLSLDTCKLESALSVMDGCGGVNEVVGGGDQVSHQVLDVSCCQVSGLVDREQLGASLETLLLDPPKSEHQDYIELRALILYECSPGAPSPTEAVEAAYGGGSNAGVVLLQDCSKDHHLVTALRMSSLPT